MGMNNAIASIALGSSQMRRWHQLRLAIVFALFEAGMPVIGLLIGSGVATLVGSHAKYIGVAVLSLAGLYSFFKSGGADDGPKTGLSLKTFLLAMALSLDNLTVGFSLGMISVPIAFAALLFGCISLVMTLAGLEIGRFLGRRMMTSPDKLSGIVLLLTAGLMLFH